jgi:hypothetical protein
LFSKEILPRYFKHSNYSSFVRQVLTSSIQLNMYNFHKIRESNGESYFHHESFDRFNEHKLSEIKRKPEKKKRKNDESDSEAFSDHEEKENVKPSLTKKVKEESVLPLKNEKDISEKKIEDTKNTRHFFSEECNGEGENEQEGPSWRGLDIDELEDDKISINNEISERLIPRLATRELIYPSNNNLFPFGAGKAQTSTFCLFY